VGSEFRRVAPQVVEHVDGWRVQIADRYHVEYVNGADVVRVDADLDGPIVRLRPAEADPAAVALMVEGLRAMGDEVGCRVTREVPISVAA
jgi:hypothetical protein